MSEMDLQQKSIISPVVVGGVGGSGTRVVALILKQSGYNIGEDLNESLDNLTFTFLFKRPKWLSHNVDNEKAISAGLTILRKTLVGGSTLSVPEHVFVVKALVSMALHGHNHKRDGRGKWALDRWLQLLHQVSAVPAMEAGWGWKEPNSYLILKFLYHLYPSLRYIHCVRHGLDMAYSQNQQQLMNWGRWFGITAADVLKDRAQASFRFWKEANRSVINYGARLGPGKFYLLNFDRMCLRPGEEVRSLMDFVQPGYTGHNIEQLAGLPKLPPSSGRYKNEKMKWLTRDDRDFLLQLGFDCPLLEV